MDNKLMSLKDWLITLIVLMIPIVNIVMLFVWGFSSESPSRANFCKAQLILYGIGLLLSLLLLLFR